MVMKDVERLNAKLDERESTIKAWENRYLGQTPLSYLSPESRKALQNRLNSLSANFCRLVVDAIVERLKITGFVVNGSADNDLWERWIALGGQECLREALTDALISGKGYLSVWGILGDPTLSSELPSQTIIERDSLTGQPVLALKRWQADNRAHALFFTLSQVRLLTSDSHVPEGGVIPASNWTVTQVLPNPLGRIPVVALTNRGRTGDVHGISEMAAVSDLNDALEKALIDAMVTSEDFARPRRYATGLEIAEDEEGTPQDPFPDRNAKLWVSEDPSTKFGQFPHTDLGNYSTLVELLLSQISALSALPSHYIFSKQSPSSSEEVRAREVSLVAKCEQKIRSFDLAVAEVARLMVSVRDNADPSKIKVTPVWADCASRTISQESDAVSKLASGDRPILPLRQARQKLGYSLSEIQEMERQDSAEAALRLASGL